MDARNPRGSKKKLLHQTAEPSIRSEIPERSGPSPAGQPQTTAQGVVTSLALPRSTPGILAARNPAVPAQPSSAAA